jgi:hypothetical protein
MSALELTVRVNSEKQTLILAGEAGPRRPLTIVATPVDDPRLIGHGSSEEFSAELTVSPRHLVSSHRFADRGSAYSAANAYARTQELSGSSARTAIIDTYA